MQAIGARRRASAGRSSLDPRFLQKSAVTPATRDRYLKAAAQLVAFTRRRRLPLSKARDVDHALVTLLHQWFFEGKQLGKARYLVYGTAWARDLPTKPASAFRQCEAALSFLAVTGPRTKR